MNGDDNLEALKIIIENDVDVGMVRVSATTGDYNLWTTGDMLAKYLTDDEFDLIKRKIKEYERR